jgi:arylsulfatase A-like enzyme
VADRFVGSSPSSLLILILFGAFGPLPNESEHPAVEWLDRAIVVIIQGAELFELRLRDRQGLWVDEPTKTFGCRRGRQRSLVAEKRRVFWHQRRNVHLSHHIHFVFSGFVRQMPDDRFQLPVLLSFLKEYPADQQMLAIVLVNEMHFQIPIFSVDRVLTQAVKVELHKVILPPVIFHAALGMDNLLDGVPIVHHIDSVRFVRDLQRHTSRPDRHSRPRQHSTSTSRQTIPQPDRAMKKHFLVFATMAFLNVPLMAALKLSVAGDSEQLPQLSRTGGWTKVSSGNDKGQTIELNESGNLQGILLQLGAVDTAKDLTVSILGTAGGFPTGKPFFSDTGDLPPEIREGESLTVEFQSALPLEPGTYAIVVSSQGSNLKLRMSSANGYPAGRAIRKNASSKGKWTGAGGAGSDLIFRLLGSVEGTSIQASGYSAVPTIELLKHKNPAFKPSQLSDLKRQPNIVTIMVDDLGWNQLGVTQSTMGTNPKIYQTPNLAKLATGGLSFTHAYTQPNCAPTRAAMLSGQYPARIHNDVYIVGNLNRNGGGGISRKNAKFLGPEQTENVAAEAITVAEALRENGYATAHIGKYHVGGHGGDETLPENVGFDVNIGGFSQGHQPVCFARMKDGEWEFSKLGRGDFDRFGAPYTEAYLKKYNFPRSLLNTPKHVSDALSDAMEETLRSFAKGKKPFYLQLHPYAVHGPVKSRPDLKAAAGGDELAGFVSSIDLTLGRLQQVIADPNGDGDTRDSLVDNTLILFTSDNGGTHKDNLPLRGKKGMFTEGGVRVPLIAYWPGVIPANTVTDHMVHSVDYYPTYLKLAGDRWTPPASGHPLDGESFADVLLDPNLKRSRDPIFYLFPGYMDVRAQPCVVVIDEVKGQRHKLLYFYEADGWELYNLSEDIGEKSNLISSEPAIAAALSKKIRTWLTQQHPTWKPKYPLNKESGEPAGPPPVL